jgi:polyisoprenoid-binding protein YceI
MITTVKGRFTDVSGTVVTDQSDPAAAEVDITIGVGSIDTREPQRDAHLRSADFFEAEKFPAMTFRSRRVENVQGPRFTLVGDLTIRGVSPPGCARGFLAGARGRPVGRRARRVRSDDEDQAERFRPDVKPGAGGRRRRGRRRREDRARRATGEAGVVLTTVLSAECRV